MTYLNLCKDLGHKLTNVWLSYMCSEKTNGAIFHSHLILIVANVELRYSLDEQREHGTLSFPLFQIFWNSFFPYIILFSRSSHRFINS